MKGSTYKIPLFKTAALGMAFVPAVALLSCHDANAGKDNSQVENAFPRPDDALAELTRSLAEKDAPAFAGLCTYPILRPYPLRAIEDSVSMVDYFNVLVDDSLSSMFRNSSLEDWESYGWRGWSFAGSTPLWYDEGIQIIDYISPAEAGIRRILAREEIMSLAPQFRDGWTPVMTLVETDGSRVFRIDSKDAAFRLMGFDSADNPGGVPSLLLSGSVRTEGSASLPVYTFTNSEGMQAEVIPDAEPSAVISLKRPGSVKEDIFNVRAGYWRDIFK